MEQDQGPELDPDPTDKNQQKYKKIIKPQNQKQNKEYIPPVIQEQPTSVLFSRKPNSTLPEEGLH